MAELALRKIIVFLIILFVIFFGFISVYKLKNSTSSYLSTISIQSQKQECDNGGCIIINCDLKENSDCSNSEKNNWKNLLNYLKTCKLPDGTICDNSLTKAIILAKEDGKNNLNLNNTKNNGFKNTNLNSNLPKCSVKLKKSLGVNCEKILSLNKLNCKVRPVKKLSPEFLLKVKIIAEKIGSNQIDLLKVIKFESGHTFCSCALNKVSGAVGLIQFMPKTARGLNTNSLQLCEMSELNQLDYVLNYLKSNSHSQKLNSLDKLYMSVLCPAAISRKIFTTRDGSILCNKRTKVGSEYNQNKGLDSIPQDGIITVAEATQKVREMKIKFT